MNIPAAPARSNFNLIITLTDEASGRSGSLSFPGYALGTVITWSPDMLDPGNIAFYGSSYPSILKQIDLQHLLYSDADAAGDWTGLDDPGRGLPWVSRSLTLSGNTYTVMVGKHPVDWGGYPYDPSAA